MKQYIRTMSRGMCVTILIILMVICCFGIKTAAAENDSNTAYQDTVDQYRDATANYEYDADAAVDAIIADEENKPTEKEKQEETIAGVIVFFILVGGTAFLIYKAVRRHGKSEENN